LDWRLGPNSPSGQPASGIQKPVSDRGTLEDLSQSADF
jgi:hypothetical protein